MAIPAIVGRIRRSSAYAKNCPFSALIRAHTEPHASPADAFSSANMRQHPVAQNNVERDSRQTSKKIMGSKGRMSPSSIPKFGDPPGGMS